jgi:hypothetical protein
MRSLPTIKSEDESVLDDVPLERPCTTVDLQGTSDPTQKATASSFLEDASANPQDNSENRAFVVSTASV